MHRSFHTYIKLKSLNKHGSLRNTKLKTHFKTIRTNWPLIWDKIEEGFKIFWVKYKFYKDSINISYIAFVNKFILAISANFSH